MIVRFAIACAAIVCAPCAGFAADPDEDDAIDTIIVSATRSPGLIRDTPLRVEAVPADEIEENATIQPGALTTLFKELPGVRVQSTAGGLGGAGTQLRGLPARQTLVLSDGLPLLGLAPDAFGLLQTPPLDLERAEVIKGAVSALYGGSALGGVLNLVSKTPDANSTLLANATSRGGQDVVAFLASGTGAHRGTTLTVGAHHQSSDDVDDDGWLESPAFHRVTFRPRMWWHDGSGRSLYLTGGMVDERREGGTATGRTLPDGSPFAEALDTRRYDAGAVFESPAGGTTTFSGRLSFSSARLDRSFGEAETLATQRTANGEAAWNGGPGNRRWVLGFGFSRDELVASGVTGVDYRHDASSAFAQQEWSVASWLRLSASARLDHVDPVGTFLSPRVSALLRPADSEWSVRASLGGGFAAPTPYLEEIEETGLSILAPLAGLHAERARTASIDAKWADEGWDFNASVFYSEIRDPLITRPAGNGLLAIVNADAPWRAPGAELLLGFTKGPWHLLASGSYLDATEGSASGGRAAAARIPRATFSLDGIYEIEKRGRVGIEIDYTGPQALADDPYRARSPGYLEINALAERTFGRIAIFANAINLTNRRQTDFDPLVRPIPGLGGNPITDVWAPLAGRTFNVGIRAIF